MKIKFRKEVECAVMIRDVTGWYWKLASTFKEIQFAIDMAESILKDQTVWDSGVISAILIVDVNTDEILAEVVDDTDDNIDDDSDNLEDDDWDYEDEVLLIASEEDKSLKWLYDDKLPF